MRHSVIADMFSIIKNAEDLGKSECSVPASNLVRAILSVMERHEYVKSYELLDDGRNGKFIVRLVRRINDCNVISPQYSVKKDSILKYEKRYLPAAGTGILILSTSKGVIDHNDARSAGIGGKLLGFVY